MRSSVRARSGCRRRSPARRGRRSRVNCATEAGYFFISGQHLAQRPREAVGHEEAVAGQRDRRLHQAAPGQLAVLLPGHVQAGHGAGHAHRQVALVVRARRRSVPSVQEHRRAWLPAGADLAEVVGHRLARRPAGRARNPPPPMLPAVGWVTARAKAVATAASTALPPSHRTSAPTCEAMKFCETTMPLRARAGGAAAEAGPDDAQAIAATAATSTEDRTRTLMGSSSG